MKKYSVGVVLLGCTLWQCSSPSRNVVQDVDKKPLEYLEVAADATVTLESGAAFKRRINTEERHVYVADLTIDGDGTATQNTAVRILQRDVDLSLRLVDPAAEGGELMFDFPHGFRGEELLILPPGVSRFVVVVEDALPPAPEYELRIEPLAVADAATRAAQVRAQASYAEGWRLHFRTSPPNRAEAMVHYEAARDLYAGIGLERSRAYASMQMASCLYASDKSAAMIELESALGILEDLDDLAGTVYSKGSLAKWLIHGPKPRSAIPRFEASLSLAETLGDSHGEMMVLSNFAWLLDDLGEKRRALELIGQALETLRSLGKRADEPDLLNNMAKIYNDLGEYDRAVEMYRQVIDLQREFGTRQGEGRVMLNLASALVNLGQAQEALDGFYRGLRILEDVEDEFGVAVAHHGLGQLYSKIGSEELAVHHYRLALRMNQAAGRDRFTGISLSNLGGVLQKMGRLDEAEKLLDDSLEVHRRTENRRFEAYSLNSLARLHVGRADLAKARRLFEDVLEVWREVGDPTGETDSLRNLGQIDAQTGRPEQARKHYVDALELARKTRHSENEIKVLNALARLDYQEGSLEAAFAKVDAAVGRLEALREGVFSPELRTSLLASYRSFYELRVELLMEFHVREPGSGFALQAFEASEQARARSLLEMVRESGEIRRGVPPVLRARERSLRQRLNAAHQNQRQHATGDEAEALAKVEEEIRTLLEELHLARGEIRRQSPGYSALTEPRPIAIEQLQARLGPEDLLLTYFLGSARSYVWTFGSAEGSESVTALPPRREIDALARRYARLLRQSSRLEARTAAEPVAAKLATLLLGPIAERLPGRRLILVAEGALLYVPFASLPHPSSGEPLMTTHEIVVLPSASLLKEWRPREQTANPSVVVVADPVFSADDPRVAGGPGSVVPKWDAFAAVSRSLRSFGRDDLPRLPFTRQEASRIAEIAGEPARQILDFEASRAAVIGDGLAAYDIVHFATHGLLNSTHPELSGLVFSMVDAEGRSQDGFLRLHEIYNLELAADLVVLSGCETALGKEIAGEGLIGLTRGFLYAGARGVVASLWPIEDRATAIWMTRFYEAHLGQGLSPSAALREAQRALWHDPATASPYFWAGFQYQGAL